MINPTRSGETPASAVTEPSAAKTPFSGAAVVVRVLTVKRRSPSSSATSVKVPPISTPRRIVGEDDTRERLSRYSTQQKRAGASGQSAEGVKRSAAMANVRV